MKVFFFNDTKRRMCVRVIKYNNEEGNSISFLSPLNSGEYDIGELPSGYSPWIKLWDNDVVLISYIENTKEKV